MALQVGIPAGHMHILGLHSSPNNIACTARYYVFEINAIFSGIVESKRSVLHSIQ